MLTRCLSVRLKHNVESSLARKFKMCDISHLPVFVTLLPQLNVDASKTSSSSKRDKIRKRVRGPKKRRCKKKVKKTASSSGRGFVKIVMHSRQQGIKRQRFRVSRQKGLEIPWTRRCSFCCRRASESEIKAIKSSSCVCETTLPMESARTDYNLLQYWVVMVRSVGASRYLHASVSFPWWWTRTTFQYLWFSARRQTKDEDAI